MTAALFHPVTLVLACMCIQWVTLGSVGPFSVKLPYLTLGLAILYAASSERRLAACLQFMRQNAAWLAPLAIYLVLLTAALFGSHGQNMPLRQAFYLPGVIAVAGCLAVSRNIPAILRLGSALALAFFIVAVEVMARSIGLSWSDAIAGFFQGDLQFVVYKFFRPVFNALDPNGDITVVASQKNGIAVCVLVAALLFRSGSARPWLDLTGIAVLGLALFLLVLLNTRSVLIVTGVSILVAIAVSAVVRPAQLSVLMLKALAAGAIIVLAVGYAEPETAASDTMSERFAFEDQSTSGRMQQYEAAAEMIAAHPFAGNGYFELDGRPIHNLFLSAWVHAGLAGFLLVVAFYVALLAKWIGFLWKIARQPGRWVLPIAVEWIAPLPILPLFRVWLAGDGGHLFLGEWVAVAAFFGLVLANDLRSRTVVTRRAAGAMRGAPAPASGRPAQALADRSATARG